MRRIISSSFILFCICFMLTACSSVEFEPTYTQPPKAFEYTDIMSEELVELLDYARINSNSEDFVKENAISSFRDERYGQTYYVIGEGVLLDIPCQVTWSWGSIYLFGDFKVDECRLYEQKLEDAMHCAVETWGDKTIIVYLSIPDEEVAKIRLKFDVVYDERHTKTNKYRVWIFYDADGDVPVNIDFGTLSTKCCLSHCNWDALEWSPYCVTHGCCKEGCRNRKDPFTHCCEIHNCKKDGCGAHRYDRMNSEYCNMHYR